VSFVDLARRLDEPGVFALLTEAFGSSDTAQQAKESYVVGDWTALGYEEGGAIIGFVGFERVSAKALRIRGIAVDPSRRREGIGRLLIEETRARNRGVTLHAETDSDAVRFYTCCGFEVSSLGEQYPGVERFDCRLQS
jgi:GNAT superfamily N-acetyltransferase